MPQRSKAFNGNSSASNTPSMPSRTMPVRRTSSSHSITGDPPNTSWMDRLRTTANQVAGKTDSHRHDNLHSHAYPSSFNNINNGHGLQDGLAPSSNEQTTLKWPIVILALPPIGALFVGTAQGWSDGITLVFIGIYLYYLVKVPWELYHATQTDAATRKLALSANATPQQRLALASLRKQEWLSLFLVLVAPLLGGYALYLAKNYLMIAQYLTPSNIMLYVMVASMRPLTHMIHLLQGRAVELQRDLAWHDTDAAQLRRRLDQLELSLRELRLACATEDDVDALKDEVRSVLGQVSRGTRQQLRKEQKERLASATRIDMTEERVREVEEWCERQRARQSHNTILRLMWEPMSVFKEAIGVARVPLLGFGGPSDNGSGATTSRLSKDTNTALSATNEPIINHNDKKLHKF